MKLPKFLRKKEKEEKNKEPEKNIPLFFLRLFDLCAKRKILPSRRYLYYPAFFIFVYLVIFLYAREIETTLTFPVLLNGDENAQGVEAPFLGGEHFLITTKDHQQIHGVFMDNKAQKTVFFFHGNGLPLPYFINDLEFFSNLGYNVMSFDYPGYGKSTGFPYEKNIYDASEEFYSYVKREKNLDDTNIVVVGSSVGSAPAVEFASRRIVDKIILLAAFTSRYDLSRVVYGWAVQKLFFLPNSFEIDRKIPYINRPILYVHGNEDSIIPILLSKRLFRITSDKSFYIEIDNQEHNNIIENYGYTLSLAFKTFIEKGELSEPFYFIDKNQEAIFSKESQEATSSGQTLSPKQNIFNLNLEKSPSNDELVLSGSVIKLPEGYINPFDLDTDSSFTKFVDPTIGFSNPNYTPENLVEIDSDYIYAKKGTSYLRQEAKEALENMGRDFYNNFGSKIGITSSYRSFTYQKGIKDNGCSDALCAHPGHSEHQAGLAVDLFEASSEDEFLKKSALREYYWWMKQNAHKYGFHNTYQKGAKVDGYVKEPWHWRYVGVELATLLHEHNMTFAEYYYAIHDATK